MEHSDRICVKTVRGKGRGVFARRPIRRGAVIELVPLVLIPLKDFVGGANNRMLRK